MADNKETKREKKARQRKERRDNFDRDLKRMDDEQRKKVVKSMRSVEENFSSMLDRQQDMLLNFYRATSEAGRESVKQDMISRQETMEAQIADMKNSYLLYKDFMTKEERKMYKQMYKTSQEGMENINKEMKKRFHELQDDFDDLAESWSDKLTRITETIRDTITASTIFNMARDADISSEERRQMMRDMKSRTDRSGVGSDEDAIKRMAQQIGYQSSNSLNYGESLDALRSFVEETRMHNAKDVEAYASTMTNAEKALGVAADSMRSIMFTDRNFGSNGKLLKQVTNMAASLETNSELNVSADSILSVIEEHIDDIYGLYGKETKKSKKMVDSLAALQAIEESAANQGISEMIDKMKEWQTLTTLELSDDDTFLSLAGVMGKDWQQMAADITSGDVDKQTQILKDMQEWVSSRSDAELYAYKDILGFDKVADLKSIVNADLDDITKAAKKSIEEGNVAAESKEDKLYKMLDDKTSDLDQWLNKISNNLADVTSQLDKLPVGLDKILNVLGQGSNMFLAGSEVFKGIKSLYNWRKDRSDRKKGKYTDRATKASDRLDEMAEAAKDSMSGSDTKQSWWSKWKEKRAQKKNAKIDLGDKKESMSKAFKDAADESSDVGKRTHWWNRKKKSTSGEGIKLGKKGKGKFGFLKKAFGAAADVGTEIVVNEVADAGMEKLVDTISGGDSSKGEVDVGDDSSTAQDFISGLADSLLGEDDDPIIARLDTIIDFMSGGSGGVLDALLDTSDQEDGSLLQDMASDFLEEKVEQKLGGEAEEKAIKEIEEKGVKKLEGEAVEKVEKEAAEKVANKAVKEGTEELSEKALKEGAEAAGKKVGIKGALGTAAKVAGTALAVSDLVIDGAAGTEMSEEWLGDKSDKSKNESFIASAIGGTGSGVMGDGSVLEKIMDVGMGAMKGAGAGALGGPIGAIVGGIGGAAAAAIGGENIAKAIDTVTSTASDINSSVDGLLSDNLGSVGEGISALKNGGIDAVGSQITGVVDGVTDITNGLSGGVGKIFSGDILGGLGDIGGGVVKGAGDLISGGAGFVQNIAGGVSGFFGGAADAASNVPIIGDLLNGQLSAVSDAVDGIVGGVGDAIGGIGDGLQQIGSGDIMGGLKTAGSGLLEGVTGIFSGLGSGIADLAGGALKTAEKIPVVGDIVSGAEDAVKGAASKVGGFFKGVGSVFGFEDGLSKVPNDGLAYVHKNEAILTSDQANIVRATADGGIPFGEESKSDRSKIQELIDVFTQIKEDENKENRDFLNLFNNYGIFGAAIGSKGSMLDKLVKVLTGGLGIKATAFASGGVVNKPTLGVVGENGPEAVVPLDTEDSTDSSSVTGLKNLKGNKKAFIDAIKNGAIEGYKKYNILPSITLAQGALESGWGKSAIGNNLFGIKAGSSWKGKTQWVWTHEYENGVRKKIRAKFRDYNSIDDSVLDHAKLLAGDRYKKVRMAKNYVDAAKAVQAAGYATSPTYANSLITLIKGNGLNKWDNASYDVGTPFVPDDQVALIHQGEMIVPADQNPMNNPVTVRQTEEKPQKDSTETIKWAVSRLEAKLDKLIELQSRRPRVRGDMKSVDQIYAL